MAVVGSANYDSTIMCNNLPGPGETVQGFSHEWGLGGKGANQAVAAARAGGAAHMIGAVGMDQAGREIRGLLPSYDVDISGLSLRSGVPTGAAHIHVAAGGENHIVISAGANGTFTELTAGQHDRVQSADVLLLQLEIPVEGSMKAALAAYDAEVPVVLTPAPARPLDDSLLHYVDVLVPNQVELHQLTGIEDPSRAASSLSSRGMDVVVTLGEQGSLWASPDGFVRTIPARSVPAVDTTGAGDCFTGVFSVAWARGCDIPDAISEATAAASLCVQSVGAASSMPSATDIQNALGAEVAT